MMELASSSDSIFGAAGVVSDGSGTGAGGFCASAQVKMRTEMGNASFFMGEAQCKRERSFIATGKLGGDRGTRDASLAWCANGCSAAYRAGRFRGRSGRGMTLRSE